MRIITSILKRKKKGHEKIKEAAMELGLFSGVLTAEERPILSTGGMPSRASSGIQGFDAFHDFMEGLAAHLSPC